MIDEMAIYKVMIVEMMISGMMTDVIAIYKVMIVEMMIDGVMIDGGDAVLDDDWWDVIDDW